MSPGHFGFEHGWAARGASPLHQQLKRETAGCISASRRSWGCSNRVLDPPLCPVLKSSTASTFPSRSA